MDQAPLGGIADPLIWKILQGFRAMQSLDDFDDLLKECVEFPRRELGVERCAMWLLDVPHSLFRGCWGTGMDGRTTDEHEFVCNLRELERTLPCPFGDLEGWILGRHPERRTWTPLGTKAEGLGWNTIIPVIGPEGNIGAFFQDAALTNAELDPHLQDLMAIYATLVGQTIGRKLSDFPFLSRSDPASSSPGSWSVLPLEPLSTGDSTGPSSFAQFPA